MSVSLSPLGGAGWQFFDSNGNPLAGGLLYTYGAGTTTLTTTYTDHTGGTPNSNPIVLTSSGTVPNEIWLTGGSAYKFVLQNSLAVQQGAWDYVSGINDLNGIFTSPSLTGTPTAPTASASTNNTQIATTAFANTAANTAANNVKGELAGETLFNATATLTLAQLGQQIKFYGSTVSQVLTLVSRGTSAVGQGNWFVNIASVPVTLQTYTGDNIYSNVAGTGSSTATTMILAPGDSTYLVNDGTYWQEQQGVRAAAAAPQIQSIGASVASNALTVTYAGGNLTFRNPTLTNGASVYATCSAQTLTVPSGATMGTTSAVQSQLILVELYNGGTPVLGVANIAGGTNLDETTLLTAIPIGQASTFTGSIAATTGILTLSATGTGTFAIGQALSGVGVPSGTVVMGLLTGTLGVAGSTYSTNTTTAVSSTGISGVAGYGVYSTSAVTSSPFRVIGEVVSTQATAGTWATGPTLVQGQGGQAILGLNHGLTGAQLFITSGTFTVPAGVSTVKVTGVGGGGSGGYAAQGGAGGCGMAYVNGLTAGQTVTVTIGAGGASGSAGGSTSFGAYLTCGGGNSSGQGTTGGTKIIASYSQINSGAINATASTAVTIMNPWGSGGIPGANGTAGAVLVEY